MSEAQVAAHNARLNKNDAAVRIEATKAGLAAKPRKYRNIPTVVDGITFSSRKEARVYRELRLRQEAGQITWLELQPSYSLTVNDVLICHYRADFAFIEDGKRRVLDVKGYRTREFEIKQKLMLAVYGATVETV